MPLIAKNNDNKVSEVEIAEISKDDGILLLRVYCFSKKPNIPDDTFRMQAVYNVIFNGVSSSGRKEGRPPLIDRNTPSNSTFLKRFFDTKQYQKFASIAVNGYVNTGNLVKECKLYRVGKMVKVNESDLRKYLEENNIIEALDDGF